MPCVCCVVVSIRKRLAQALLAENGEAAQHILWSHLKPMTRKNGDVCYRLKDGGQVADVADAVQVPAVTEASALLALTLAQARFPGQVLIVEGDTTFKVKVAEMAVSQGLNLRFADPDLEKTCERMMMARQITAEEQRKGPTAQKSQEKNQKPDHGQPPDTGRGSLR